MRGCEPPQRMTKGARPCHRPPLGPAEATTGRDGHPVEQLSRGCPALAFLRYGTLERNSVVTCRSSVAPSSQSIVKSPWMTSVDDVLAGSSVRWAHVPSVAGGHPA